MSVFFNHPQLTGNPFVDRIVKKRDATHAELHALREELQVLKDVIRSKQERLRKMNKAIILRHRSVAYLQLVSSQPLPHKPASPTVGAITLHCLEGGK